MPNKKNIQRAPESATADVEGIVTSVTTDEHVVDPESPQAVQGHDDPRVNQSRADGLSVHDEPTPEEVFASQAVEDKPSKKRSKND